MAGGRLGVLVAVFWSQSGLARAAPPTIEDALRQAKQSGKPALLEFGAIWCGPCKKFEAQVLPEREVQDALRDVMFVRYDAEVEPGRAAAVRYEVDSYPTFVMVDGEGKTLATKRGFLGKKAFIALVGRAAVEGLSREQVEARLKANPDDPRALLAAARWHASRSVRSSPRPPGGFGTTAGPPRSASDRRSPGSRKIDRPPC